MSTSTRGFTFATYILLTLTPTVTEQQFTFVRSSYIFNEIHLCEGRQEGVDNHCVRRNKALFVLPAVSRFSEVSEVN